MRKVFVALLCAMLFLCLCACGGGVSETKFRKAIDELTQRLETQNEQLNEQLKAQNEQLKAQNEQLKAQDKRLKTQETLIAALQEDSVQSQTVIDNLVKNNSLLRFEGKELSNNVLHLILEYNDWIIDMQDSNIVLKFPVDMLDVHTEYYVDGILSDKSRIYRSGFFTERVTNYRITSWPTLDGNLNVTFKYRIIGYILN